VTEEQKIIDRKEFDILSSSILHQFLRECSHTLVAERLEKRPLGRIDIGERIILKYIIEKSAM
jgi:hypothetical protein